MHGFATHPFGRAQEQVAAGAQGIVEQRQYLRLQIFVQIDQQVAAGDQVDPRKGRIAQHRMQRETHPVAQLRRDLHQRVAMCGIGRAHLLGDVGQGADRIGAGAGDLDHLLVDVAGEHGEAGPQPGGAHFRIDQHRDGVGLLAGRAAGDPDAQLLSVGGRDHRADRLFAQGLEHLGVAEEPRHVDQELVQQRLAFVGMALQMAQIVARAGNVEDLQPPADAPHQRRHLVAREIVPAPVQQVLADQPRIGQHRVVGLLRFAGIEELQDGGHDPFRRQNIVHQPGRLRREGHSVIPGGTRFLDDADAAMFLDRAQPQRAVRPRARQDHAGSGRATVMRQAFEKVVDWAAQPARLVEIGQMQASVADQHPRAGGDGIDMTRLQHRAVGRLLHAERGAPVQQFGQNAVMRRVQVLDDDIGSRVLAPDVAQQVVQRLEPPGRGADADDGEGRTRGGACGRGVIHRAT